MQLVITNLNQYSIIILSFYEYLLDFRTIPRTVCNLIEIIISMSENEDNEIRSSNQIFLDRLSNELSADIFSVLFETLEEGFLNGLNKLPRKMNSIGKVNF